MSTHVRPRYVPRVTLASREAAEASRLRAYVRHAELYGGYDSVFEEAGKDLSPVDLAHLCSALRGFSHDYRVKRSNGHYRTLTETFKVGSSQREALVSALIREGIATSAIVDLIGCSPSYVYGLVQRLQMGSQSPETGYGFSTGELPKAIPLPRSDSRQTARESAFAGEAE
jgi:hypothetical protein